MKFLDPMTTIRTTTSAATTTLTTKFTTSIDAYTTATTPTNTTTKTSFSTATNKTTTAANTTSTPTTTITATTMTNRTNTTACIRSDIPNACDGNLCQNGGTCTSMCPESDDIENSMILKCSCVEGFTGDFCQFKRDQDHLLFVTAVLNRTELLFNGNGRLIGERPIVDEQIAAYGSCSTVFNGEAIIFGGWTSIFHRQVQ